MTKRVVLRHANGLRQILGALDVASEADIPTTLHGVQIDQVTCELALRAIRPRYCVYEETTHVAT